ncbi:MAG: tail fiber protein, partial [Bacteroidota bacterium]
AALYAILGTFYGGDGRTTFQLPDFRGRMALGTGDGPGLTERFLSQQGGLEERILDVDQLPSHSHSATTTNTVSSNGMEVNSATFEAHLMGTDAQADEPGPDTERVLAEATVGNVYRENGIPDIPLRPGSVYITGSAMVNGAPKVDSTTTIHSTGGNQPITFMNPFLCMNFIICIDGIFPSRN